MKDVLGSFYVFTFHEPATGAQASFRNATDNGELNTIANHDLIPVFLERTSLMFVILNERLL